MPKMLAGFRLVVKRILNLFDSIFHIFPWAKIAQFADVLSISLWWTWGPSIMPSNRPASGFELLGPFPCQNQQLRHSAS